jgi:addiction module HigA family antidote
MFKVNNIEHEDLHEDAPKHPGVLLREYFLPALNMHVSKVAELLDVMPMTLFQLLRAKYKITPNMALRLEKLLANDENSINAEQFMIYQVQYDLYKERLKQDLSKVKPYKIK